MAKAKLRAVKEEYEEPKPSLSSAIMADYEKELHARKKKALIDTGRHTIVESPHPSPLSAHRGFFGSKPFSRINAWRTGLGLREIDWRL